MKTVFIIGAAANKELDANGSMPFGTELANRIQTQLTSELLTSSQFPDGVISGIFSRMGGLGADHVAAMTRIAQGITFADSIDEFLDEWSDQALVMEVGKVAIAHQILEAEARTKFPQAIQNSVTATSAMTEIRNSWLGQILRYSNENARRRDVAKCLTNIGFVTFNYDRCLEAALYIFGRFGQNLSDHDARAILDRVPILHAYGKLGSIFEGSNLQIPLGAEQPWSIHKASDQIRTFTEEVDSEHRERIRDLVASAEKIVFLGFGYNRRNLDLICPDRLDGKTLYGTTYKMREPQIAAAQSFFVSRGSGLKFDKSECGVLIDKMREHVLP